MLSGGRALWYFIRNLNCQLRSSLVIWVSLHNSITSKWSSTNASQTITLGRAGSLASTSKTKVASAWMGRCSSISLIATSSRTCASRMSFCPLACSTMACTRPCRLSFSNMYTFKERNITTEPSPCMVIRHFLAVGHRNLWPARWMHRRHRMSHLLQIPMPASLKSHKNQRLTSKQLRVAIGSQPHSNSSTFTSTNTKWQSPKICSRKKTRACSSSFTIRGGFMLLLPIPHRLSWVICTKSSKCKSIE